MDKTRQCAACRVHRATTIDVVETVYSGIGRRDSDDWLREMLASIASCVGEGLGGVVDRSTTSGLRIGGDARVYSAGAQVCIDVVGMDEQRLVFAINVREGRRLALAERRRLATIATHLGAALRLGPQLSSLAGPEEPAVLSPPRRLLVARVRTARDHLDAGHPLLASWDALVSGRSTLVDRFELEGRRYIVAHPNGPAGRDPRGLTRAEAMVATRASRGHADKLIAAELCVREGTVSGLLARVFRKLGVHSRTAMAARLTPPPRATAVALPHGDVVVVFSADRHADDAACLAPLTSAERGVARAIGRGLKNEEIARERGVSARTIEGQLSAIFRKLGVRSRVELRSALG